jgi:O-antigen ligase
MSTRATRKQQTAARQSPANAPDRIDRSIHWITLVALFVIPLVFSYFQITAVFTELKILALHLSAGLIASLWLWQIALRRLDARTETGNEFNWDLLKWAGRSPANWALIAMGLWVFAQLASTLLSPLPVLSLFGENEGRAGYNLYDSLSLTVIFLSVVFRFRTHESLLRIAYTLVLTGTIAAAYGLAQHFGWDPIGHNDNLYRPIASFGNTLNFGGYMAMSIPATLALIFLKRAPNQKWIWLAAIVFTLGMQLASLWITSSRGPWIAGVTAVASFFIIAFIIASPRDLLKPLLVLVAALMIGYVFVALPSPKNVLAISRVSGITGDFNANSTSTDIGAGLAGRLSLWNAALKIATTWPVPAHEPALNSILRPVFGVGPDMLVYSYPLVLEPQTNLSNVEHAHNYVLQILVEQGYTGFLAFVGFSVLLGLSILVVIRKRRIAAGGIDITAIIMLALLPAMIGKMVDLQATVSRVSDLPMTFALFGVILAIYALVKSMSDEDEDAPTTNSSSVSVSASNQTMVGVTLLAAVGVTAVLLTMFIGWDLRRLSASRALASGYDSPELQVRAAAWTKAQAGSPERGDITHGLAVQYHKTAEEQFELGYTAEAMRLILIGRDMLLEYEQNDPFEWDTQITLSKMAATLATWGHFEFAQELADRATKIVDLYPAYPTLVGTSATAMTSVGLHERAIEYADMVIAVEDTTQPFSKAWYAKGRALYELGFDDEAIEVLITATEKQPGAEGALLSHSILAEIYTERGEDELAKIHADLGAGDITAQE